MTSVLSRPRILGHNPTKAWRSPLRAFLVQRWASSSSGVVELAYERAEPPSPPPEDAKPIVILHGLFGQKQNWRSLARAMAKSLETNVYAVDLRNHGTSPHNPDMRTTSVAMDVLHFFNTHGLSQVSLIGHSMGGKVASALALQPNISPDVLSSLIIVDVTPAKIPISDDFAHYVHAMKAVEAADVPDLKSAYNVLSEFNVELPIQQFLLTNLASTPGPRRFRIPLDILTSGLREIGDFPYEPGEVVWDGPTMVIRGTNSDYVTDKRASVIQKFFPNTQLKSLEAGHWVHSEKPGEFLQLVKEFLQGPSNIRQS